MISETKLQELRDRMVMHDVENDVAVVKLTARELQELLDEISMLQELLAEAI